MADPAGSSAAWKRAALRRALAVLLLAVVGLVLAFATDGTASDVGYGLFGIAVVLALSLAFLEVGFSEDRARAREQRRRGRGSGA
jgi:hypothetical protein